jgi:hypothetical protein
MSCRTLDLRHLAASQPQTCSSPGGVVQVSNDKMGKSGRGDHQWIGFLPRPSRGARTAVSSGLREAGSSLVCVSPHTARDDAACVLPLEILLSASPVLWPSRRILISSQIMFLLCRRSLQEVRIVKCSHAVKRQATIVRSYPPKSAS